MIVIWKDVNDRYCRDERVVVAVFKGDDMEEAREVCRLMNEVDVEVVEGGTTTAGKPLYGYWPQEVDTLDRANYLEFLYQ